MLGRIRLNFLNLISMTIVAFAATTSSQSINRELIKYVLKSFTDHQVNFLDLSDFEMPIFSEDREKEGYPLAARKFLEAIAQSDAVVCSLAEHNRSYSAAFKNIFDWASRIETKVFQQKPMLLLSTSPGAYGGGNVMAAALKFFPQFGADIRESFSLPKFLENFDREKTSILPAALKNELDEKVLRFKKQL